MTEPAVIVFDLDDTLYLERDFARSGYAAVGAMIAAQGGPADIAARANRLFDSGERSHVFDSVLAELGLPDAGGLLEAMIAAYRFHHPTIRLAPDARAFLDRHAGRRPLALVTDGDPTTQLNKIRALGLNGGAFAPIVRTGAWGPGYGKPHHRAFAHVEAHHALPPRDFVYVADNCAKDFIAPRARGWRTVRIRRDGGIHAAEPNSPEARPDAEVTSLDELDDLFALHDA